MNIKSFSWKGVSRTTLLEPLPNIEQLEHLRSSKAVTNRCIYPNWYGHEEHTSVPHLVHKPRTQDRTDAAGLKSVREGDIYPLGRVFAPEADLNDKEVETVQWVTPKRMVDEMTQTAREAPTIERIYVHQTPVTQSVPQSVATSTQNQSKGNGKDSDPYSLSQYDKYQNQLIDALTKHDHPKAPVPELTKMYYSSKPPLIPTFDSPRMKVPKSMSFNVPFFDTKYNKSPPKLSQRSGSPTSKRSQSPGNVSVSDRATASKHQTLFSELKNQSTGLRSGTSSKRFGQSVEDLESYTIGRVYDIANSFLHSGVMRSLDSDVMNERFNVQMLF
jgi:hypothetical protein